VVVDFEDEEEEEPVDPVDPPEPLAVAGSPADELLPPPPQAATAAATKTSMARKTVLFRSDFMADLRA
jgi:hypothetical protein